MIKGGKQRFLKKKLDIYIKEQKMKTKLLSMSTFMLRSILTQSRCTQNLFALLQYLTFS